MKHLYTLILLVFTISSVAQVSDRTETNCEGESRSIYQAGDEGLPLLVASKGFDCGICQNQADDVIEFAQANTGNVEVWAAIINLYSSAIPTCQNIANWNSTYSWDETIFSFLDLDEHWLLTGTPIYYVIHPSTREIVYQGANFSTASSTALSLGATSVSDEMRNESFRVYQGDRGIVVNKPLKLNGELRIFNIVGQEVFSALLTAEKDQFTLNFNPIDGIYISSFYSTGIRLSTKFIFKN
ncbi:MAG: hypothetical protein ACJAQ4_000966 [Cryomorphaceae bacterium]|jgi:hypothetical protein